MKWLLQANLYTIGVLLASSSVGVIVASIGLMLKFVQVNLPLWIVSILALGYGLKEFGLIKLPMPQKHWQVPISWINKRPIFGSFAYGLAIGTGFLTYIPYAGYYIWTALVLIIGSLKLGAFLGFMYGLGRALPIYLSGLTKSSGNKDIFEISEFIYTKGQLWHRLSGALLFGTGVYLLTSA
jgi:hypothetical protein